MSGFDATPNRRFPEEWNAAPHHTDMQKMNAEAALAASPFVAQEDIRVLRPDPGWGRLAPRVASDVPTVSPSGVSAR
jgi:hypothetical protein